MRLPDPLSPFELAKEGGSYTIPIMKAAEIKNLAEREPFRPFSVRLSNGAQYAFNEAREFGAPRDYHIIFYFGENESVRIDTDHIVEISEQ